MSANQKDQFRIVKWSEINEPVDNRRIFFHETNGNQSRELSMRQVCAIESAARSNPDRSIQLFYRTNNEELDYSVVPVWVHILRQYDNVQVVLIDEAQYFAQSPLESWYREGVWRTGPFHKEHMSDYLRMLSLFKGGGLYMDLDFITLKPLDEKILWNFFPYPTAKRTHLTGSACHLEHGHRLIDKILDYLATIEYKPKKYGNYGPLLITKVLTDVCGFKPRTNSSILQNCADVHLIPHDMFYPIPFEKWKVFFELVQDKMMDAFENSYAAHIWNKASSNVTLQKNSNQLYLKLASDHCPLAFQMISEFPDNGTWIICH